MRQAARLRVASWTLASLIAGALSVSCGGDDAADLFGGGTGAKGGVAGSGPSKGGTAGSKAGTGGGGTGGSGQAGGTGGGGGLDATAGTAGGGGTDDDGGGAAGTDGGGTAGTDSGGAAGADGGGTAGTDGGGAAGTDGGGAAGTAGGGGSSGTTSDASVGIGGATSGTVACGGDSCALPNNLCCVSSGFPLQTACSPTFPGCVMFGIPVRCDDAADCESGQHCCAGAALGGANRISQTRCQTSCTGQLPITICRQTSECPGATTCQALAATFSAYGSCR